MSMALLVCLFVSDVGGKRVNRVIKCVHDGMDQMSSMVCQRRRRCRRRRCLSRRPARRFSSRLVTVQKRDTDSARLLMQLDRLILFSAVPPSHPSR